MRISGFLRTVFFLAVFTLASTIYAANQTPSENPLPIAVGKVVWIKGGEFHAIMPNNEKRILQKSSILYLHDTLKTDPNAEAEIIFTDKTLMTFRTDTTFYINQYAYKPGAKTGSVGKYVMDLIEGGFRTITGLIAKSNPPDYQVNTPVATIGVRGTDYTVYFRNGEMYVGYYEGKPCVKGKKQGELCLDDQTPYGYVPNVNSAPVPLSQQPSVFQQKLEITPASISPFYSNSTGSGSFSGTVTSFCITY